MSLGEFAVGSLVFAGTWGAALAVAAVITSRRLPRHGGVPRVLAFALIGLAALIAFHLLPGIVGLLSRWSALVVGLAALGLVYRFVPRVPGAPHDDTPPAAWDTGPVSWVIAALGGALVLVYGVAQLWVVSAEPSLDLDTLAFQLPVVGRWMETGSIWGIHALVPLQPHGNYPHNGDIVLLSAVEPFRSDFLVRLIGAPFVLLAGLSAYAIGRELRAPRATAALAAVVFVALPAVSRAGYLGAKPDPIFLAAFGSGVLFMLRHLRLGRTGDLVLAGLGLGLAFGTKWYALPAVAIVVVVWAGAALLQRRGTRFVVRGGLVMCGLIAVGGGIWFLRNAIQSGSPLYPLATPGFGEVPVDYYRDCVGYSISHYLTDATVLNDFIRPGLETGLGFGGLVLALGWLGAALFALGDRVLRREPPTGTDARSVGKAARRRQRAASAPVITAVVASGLLGLVYLVTPYTALGLEGEPFVVAGNTRYLTPALLFAAPLLAWAAGRLGKLRVGAELLMLIGVADGVRRSFDVTAKNLVVAVFLLGAAAAAGYAIYALRHRRRVLIPVAVGVAALVFALAHVREERFSDDRYVNDPAIAYLTEKTPEGSRVALAGAPPSNQVAPGWPAFGPRFDTHVEYLGHDVDGQLREYDDERSWRAALERGRFDVLVVGRGGYAAGCNLPGSETDDDAWARAAELPVVARTDRLTVYRVPR